MLLASTLDGAGGSAVKPNSGLVAGLAEVIEAGSDKDVSEVMLSLVKKRFSNAALVPVEKFATAECVRYGQHVSGGIPGLALPSSQR